jgi:hypothetical protein
MQAVLDALKESESGKDVATVKAALRQRWQQDFETTLSDDLLDTYAEKLAAGVRVVLTLR